MKHHRESGYILVGVLLAITILSVVGVSLVSLSANSVKTSSSERDNQAVYYIAEAGLIFLASEFERAVSEIYEKDSIKTRNDFYSELESFGYLPDRYENFEKVDMDKPYTLLKIEKVGEESGKYKLVSTGYIGDVNRTTTQIIQVDWKEKYKENSSGTFQLPPFAVFTSGQFTMTNGTINGDIGTLNSHVNGISFPSGGPTLNGNAFVPQGKSEIVNTADYIHINVKEIEQSYEIPELPSFPKIPNDFTKLPDMNHTNESGNTTQLIRNNNLLITNYITNNYTLNMDDNLTFNSIKVDENNHLFINVGSEDRKIVVNHLDIKNGHVNIIGDGNLTIYIKDNFTMGSGSTLNSHGKLNQLNIFYKGPKLSLDGNQKVYGSIYAESGNLYLTGSGGIYGNIFTGGKEVQMSGGSEITTQLLLAPNASVKMSAGGNLKGMIISKEFNNSGGATITLKEPFVIEGPISPAALSSKNDDENGSSGGNELEETGASPKIYKSKIREEIN